MKIAFVYMNATSRDIGRGAGYVVGSIKKFYPEYTTLFYDTKVTGAKKVIEDVIKGKFDILMVSTMTLMFPGAIDLITKIKGARKNIIVLLGGVHPLVMGRSLLEEYPNIDYLCIGEGETFVRSFLKHLNRKSLFKVGNLGFRKNGKVHINPVMPPEDLATLPPFPWSMFDKRFVRGKDGFISVTATRGCPYNCSYCCNVNYLELYGNKYIRTRPVNQVIEELKELKKIYNPGLFYFGDDMILFNTQYITELFTAIKEEVKIPYGCMGRVEKMDRDTISLLAATGCKYMAMGVECGDEKFRKEHLNRHMTNDQIIDAFSLCHENGIFTTSFNMIGYPFPNDAELTESTIKLNRKIKPGFAQVTIFYPFPGTKLHRYCVKHNLIDRKRVGSFATYHVHSVLRGYDLQAEKARIIAEFNTKPRGEL